MKYQNTIRFLLFLQTSLGLALMGCDLFVISDDFAELDTAPEPPPVSEVVAYMGMLHTPASRHFGMWSGTQCDPSAWSDEFCTDAQWESLVYEVRVDANTGLWGLAEFDVQHGLMAYDADPYAGCGVDMDVLPEDVEGYDPSERQALLYWVSDDPCGIYMGFEEGSVVIHQSDVDWEAEQWRGVMLWPDFGSVEEESPLGELGPGLLDPNEEWEGATWVEGCAESNRADLPEDGQTPEGGPQAICTPSCTLEFVFLGNDANRDGSWELVGDCDLTL